MVGCTPGSAPGPTLGNEYGKTLPLPLLTKRCYQPVVAERRCAPACAVVALGTRRAQLVRLLPGNAARPVVARQVGHVLLDAKRGVSASVQRRIGEMVAAHVGAADASRPRPDHLDVPARC